MNSPFTDLAYPETGSTPTSDLDEVLSNSPLLQPSEFVPANEEEQESISPGPESREMEDLTENLAEESDVEDQNTDNSLDLGWANYITEINELLLKATGGPGQTLMGIRFLGGVIQWKRTNGFDFWKWNGLIDMETWRKMAAAIGIAPAIFSVRGLYSQLGLSAAGLSFDAFQTACNGFRKLEKSGTLKNNRVLSIADFTQTSDKKRLFIIDLLTPKLLIQTQVAHGRNSVKPGDSIGHASQFSNTPNSFKSSQGFYVTGKTFNMTDHVDKKGVRHARGYALFLHGQEKEFNSEARARGIVIHQAEYVKNDGSTAGTSLGCPAVASSVYRSVIDSIKDGSCFFIYYNNADYLKKSSLASPVSFGIPRSISFETVTETEEGEEGDKENFEEWNETEERNEAEEPVGGEVPEKFDVNASFGVTRYLTVSVIKGTRALTGVFIPSFFKPSKSVNLVLYLHGMYHFGSRENGIEYYWKNYSNIRDCFYQGHRNAILVAPTLGSNPESPDVLLKNPNGLDDFISRCFRQLLAANLIPPEAQPGEIILAAHSAGGSPLRMILAGRNNLINNLAECWGFDCMYQYAWPAALRKMGNKPFYHYHAFQSNGAITGPGKRANELRKDHSNLKNIAPANGIHHQQVIEYAWRQYINNRVWFDPLPGGYQGSAGTQNEQVNFSEQYGPQDEGYQISEEQEWAAQTMETGHASGHETEQFNSVAGLQFTSTEDLTAEEINQQSESEIWLNDITAKVKKLPFWIQKGPALFFCLSSQFQKGPKNAGALTQKVFGDVLHPERKGATLVASDAELQKEWNALYNYLVAPFLLSSGYAVRTLGGNIAIPAQPSPVVLKPNEYGLVQFPTSGPGFARYTSNFNDSYKHPVTGVMGQHGDNWMDPQTAVDFYNLVQDFHNGTTGNKIIIHYGDSSAYDPSINLGHKTHNAGRAIDIHYFGSNGEEYTGATAWSQGDIAKVNAFLSIAAQYGFTNTYSFGKRYTHAGNNNHPQHKDHFHIGQGRSVVQHFYEEEEEGAGPDYEEESRDQFYTGEDQEAGLEEALQEGLVPVIKKADLKARIDEYLDKANSEYTLDTGTTLNCFSQFRLATKNIIAPEDAKEKVKKQLRKTKAGTKFAADNALAIHFAAYGRATPSEVKKITQALIDSGPLADVRAANTTDTDRQLVRKMQRSFGVGIDCAGYVQMAYIFAYSGSDKDPKTKRLGLGLKGSRGDENLGALSSQHFRKLSILDAQTGDLLILNARATDSDRMGHTVIVADHKTTGTQHEFIVDASWGVDLYTADAGGVARRSFFFDTATNKWWDKHPLTGAKVHENSIGPYKEHVVAGVFRPRN